MNAPSAGIAPLMRPRIDLPEVYLCRRPVDFRKGMRSLAVLVEQDLMLDPCNYSISRGRYIKEL